jgi:hypothetical protein
MRQSTKVLQSLTFFNSDLVLGDLTVNFDVKQLIKRIRGILISNKRQIRLIKRSVNKTSILTLFPHLNYLLDPADKQNVPYAVTLFEELSKTVPLTNNISRDVYQEIECLNEFVRPLLNIFINPTINLFDQLIGLAYSSHLMLFIYRKWKKKFLTRDLYQDIQDAFVCTLVIQRIINT